MNMKCKITLTAIIIIAVLSLTACNNNIATNTPVTTEDISHVTSEATTEAATLVVEFREASGKITVVKTAVLCTAPESGAGYDGFLLKGSEAELKGIDKSDTWSMIEYNGTIYYVLSSYLASSESGINLDEGGAEDMVTGDVIEIEISTDVSSENSNTSVAVVVTKPVDSNSFEAATENSLEESTEIKTTETSTKPSGTSSTNPADSNSSEAATKAATQTATAAPAPTVTQAATTAAPKTTEAPTQAATQSTTSCNHNWTPNYVAQTVTEQVWVVDQAAGEYPVYE